LSDDIEIIIYDKLEDFKDILDKLIKDNDKYNENITNIINIFNLIPKIDAGLILQLRREIKNRTGIIFKEIDEIIKERKVEIKKEAQKSQSNQNNTIGDISLDNIVNFPDTEVIPFNDDKIVITNDKVYLFGSRSRIICDSKIDVISKSMDIRRNQIIYTFKIGDIKYPSYNINGIIKKLGKRIYEATKGHNTVAHLIEEKSKNVPLRKSKYIAGWNNGWYLPMNEEKKNFTVIHYSQDQRDAWDNCKSMYKEYTSEEKEELKKKLNKFVKLTDMPEAYKAITIGLCLMAPFRLYFIKKFGIFPHVALWGITTAGKTHWLDFWSTHFTKNRLNHMSGKTASSATRIESAMTGFTGGIMIDDYKIKSPYDATDMEMVLKESATGISLRKRMRSDGITFSDNREVVSSVFTTSNALGDLFLDSALMARTVSLCYDKSLNPNKDWIKLELDLIQEKLISILYDKTKNWSDKHLDKLVEIVKRNNNRSLKLIPKRTTDIIYPKLLNIYIIILAGNLIAKKWYGINNLEIKDIWSVLIKSRRTAVKEFISIFLYYCDFALRLDPEKPIPRYLNTKLLYDAKKRRYVFMTPNIRDFNKYYDGYTNEHIKFKLTTLYERLFQALEFKELVKLDESYWFSSISRKARAIIINPILIYVGDVEPTEKSEELVHLKAIRDSGIEIITKEDREKNPALNEKDDFHDIAKEADKHQIKINEEKVGIYDGAAGKVVEFNEEE